MGGKVEAAIAGSVRALTERDPALAEKVIVGDREVNRAEVEIDDMCRRLLALRQPAASDLRFITTALKIVTDLERMGDLAVNIAERAVDLSQSPPSRPFHDLTELADLSAIPARQGARRLRGEGREEGRGGHRRRRPPRRPVPPALQRAPRAT